jgi:signal transduction histidine kinase/ketosteroid isomerase-like protein
MRLGEIPARYHKAFNDRDFDVWREIFDEDVELVVDGMTFRGVDAAVAYGVGSVTQFPGLYIGSDRVVAESGDTIVTEIELVNGDLASGRFRRQGTTCEISRVRDGRIVSCRSYYMAAAAEGEDTVRVPARGEATRVAQEQTALRRVATLVARGVSQDEIFAAVSQEISWLVGADPASLMRFEADDAITLVAAWSARQTDFPIGSSQPMNEDLRAIRESGRPWRWGPAELPATGPFVEEARDIGIRTSVGVPIVVDGRVWGFAFASSTADRPFAEDAEARIAAFTELVAMAISNAQARAEARRLGDEQAALRRVATLVARERPPAEIFATVAEEAGRVLPVEDTALLRYEHDGTATIVATWGGLAGVRAGMRSPVDGENVAALVARTGKPARVDDYATATGALGTRMRELGVGAAVGCPIAVEGRLWGVMIAAQRRREPLPADTESRLANFSDLVASAISNTQTRTEVRRLADEQAALRRVATVVARQPSPDEVFAAVTNEVGTLLRVEHSYMWRYEPDGSATMVAYWGELDAGVTAGTRQTLEGESVAALVLRTERPARIDDYTSATGSIAEYVRGLGVRSAVGAPIVIEGRLWGSMVAASGRAPSLPTGTEARMGEFTELVATAISNIEARSDLAASRARIVAAADEERRRVVRDLHDGAQQRLVHTVITLNLARQALEQGSERTSVLLDEAFDHAQRATAEVRELAHGILPSALTHGGLRAGVDALSSRMPVPVASEVSVDRLPSAVEATAYFVVAEALTNVAKHARAEHAEVTARVEHEVLRVRVRDDGVGGARPEGSGLVGLADRLAALDGRLEIESPAEGGTLVAATIPLCDQP